MTQTSLQTFSLFDDLLEQYQSTADSHDSVATIEPDEVVEESELRDSPAQRPTHDATTQYQSDALAMAANIEFRDGKMHVLDRNLVTSKIQRFQLSPSTTSSLLDDCPASWAFGKLLPFDDGPFSPAGAGGLAHEALENYYQLPKKDRTGVTFAAEIRKIVEKTFPDDAAQAAVLNRKLNALADGVFDLEDPDLVDVDRVEEKIEAKIMGIPVTGTVDRTHFNDEGQRVVVDYKTGKYRQPEYRIGYERAMRIYMLLKEAQTGQLPEAASLYFTAASKAVHVDVSDEALADAEDDLADAWDIHNTAIEEAAFPTEASPLCGWCPLANLCPTAEQAGFGPSPKAIDAGVEFVPVEGEIVEDGSQDRVSEEASEGFAIHEFGHAGHSQSEQKAPKPTAQETNTVTPQKDAMKDTMKDRPVVIEQPPYEMLTKNGEMNPNGWAANSLFKLYTRIDEAIRAAHPDFDRPAQHELTKLTLVEVADVILDTAHFWTGDDVTPQHGSFTRLCHVADTYIRNTSCDFDDEDEFNDWLQDLVVELGFATGRVLDVFDRLVPTDD